MSPAITPEALPSFADQLYEELEPFETSSGSDLRLFCEAVQAMFISDGLEDDDDVGPGWHKALMPSEAPASWLPWLAQLTGVRILQGTTEADMRAQITNAAGQRRGRPDAIKGDVQRQLTGDKRVVLRERDGSAWRITVIVYASQTPDEAAAERAARSQKPGGDIMTFEVRPGQDWTQLEANHATWADVVAAYPTWEGARDDMAI